MKVTIERDGISTTFDLNNLEDHIEKHIAQTKTFYESDMLDDIRSRVGAGACIVDIGAYIGNHSLYFANLCQSARVYSFEPAPSSFDKLRNNITLNGLDKKVTLYNKALGSISGRGSVQEAETRNAGMNKIRDDDEGSVEIDTLDSILYGREAKIDLMKIDVEGMELDVLRGGSKVLERDRPLLYIEAFDDATFQKIVDYLKGYGYESKAVFNSTPTYLFAVDTTRQQLSRKSRFKNYLKRFVSK